MIEGNFFRLDEKDSFLSEGLVIFRYLPIVSPDMKHPVYMEMTNHYISFNYHTYFYSDKEKVSTHINTELFKLPLSINLSVKDSLTTILKNAFNSFYELGNNDRYVKPIFGNKNYKEISYWNLDVFFDINKMERVIKENKKNDLSRLISFRKLILDFLYDLEHHQVFKNSPFYEEIEIKLKENFFFSSIAYKAAYYYNRELYLLDEDIYNDISFNSSYDFILEELKRTEAQWIKAIRSPLSPSLFNDSGGWFNKVEIEYRNVIFSKNDGFNHSKWQRELFKIDKNANDEYISLIKDTSKWFLKRYDFFSAFRFMLEYKKTGKIELYAILLFSLIVFPFILKTHYKPPSPTVSLVTYELLGISLFIVLLILSFWKMIQVTVNLLMPRLIMAIISAWLVFATTEELIKGSFDIYIPDKLIWLIFILIPVLVFMAMELRRIAPDITILSILNRIFVILSIALIYSIISGIFFTNFITEKILIRSGYLETYFFSIKKTRIQNENCTNMIKRISEEKGEKNSISADSLFKYLCYVKIKSNINEKIMYKVPFANTKIIVFPHMIFYRGIFVIFLGIFIQLIFEDKAVTEPI